MLTVLSETINILKICKQNKFLGCPSEFYYKFMYIAPSGDHSLLTLNLPFQVILRRFEVVFCCLDFGMRMLHFSKDWWQFVQIHQCYTLALRSKSKKQTNKQQQKLTNARCDAIANEASIARTEEGARCVGAVSVRVAVIRGQQTFIVVCQFK